MPEEPAAKVETPKTLYKYTTLDTARRILQSRTLRFSSPVLFNDPFDSQWNPLWVLHTPEMYEKILDLALKALRDADGVPTDADPKVMRLLDEGRRILNTMPDEERPGAANLFAKRLCQLWTPGAKPNLPRFESLVQSFRVLCFARFANSLLMWSHYSEQHRGIVLGFDTKTLETVWGTTARQVNYRVDLPPVENAEEWARVALFNTSNEPPVNTASEQLLNTKAMDWRYEHEWRFTTRREHADSLFGDADFPASALVKLIFGARSSRPDWLWLIESARSINPHLELLYAQTSDTAFRMRLDPIVLET